MPKIEPRLEKLGMLLGEDVYIELRRYHSKKDQDHLLEKARKFFDESFRNHEFIKELRGIVLIKDR